MIGREAQERAYLVILTGPVSSTYLTLGLTPPEAEVMGRLVRAAADAAADETCPAVRLLLLDDATAPPARDVAPHRPRCPRARALAGRPRRHTTEAAEATARGRYVA